MSKQEEAIGIPLAPAKQVQVTLPADLSIVISRNAFSQLFGYAQATQLAVEVIGLVKLFGARTDLIVPVHVQLIFAHMSAGGQKPRSGDR